MEKFPGPVNADKAGDAEARRNALKSRFRAVSRDIDRGGRGAFGWSGGGSISRLEIAIGLAGAAFVLLAAARFFGQG